MLTVKRMQEEAKSGGDVGATSSTIKALAAEFNKDRTEKIIELMGAQGLGWSGEAFTADEIKAMRGMLRAKANSIEGGTTEINLNVVAKRVLGLRDHQ